MYNIQYKTKYPEGYRNGGVRTISCTISNLASDLLEESEIEAGSRSMLINDLIVDAFQSPTNFFDRNLIAEISKRIDELREKGFEVNFNYEKQKNNNST